MEKTYAGHTMMRNAERINKNTVSGFFFGGWGHFSLVYFKNANNYFAW
jgi:hypothetical protein